MTLLLLVVLANPIATLKTQTRCIAQHALIKIADQCDTLLATKPARHRPHDKLADTLDVVWASAWFNIHGIATLLGEPELVGEWYRFPQGVQARTGRCAISVDDEMRSIWFEATTAPGYQPRIEPHCPTLGDHFILTDICQSVWEPQTVGARWANGRLRYERTVTGLKVRFQGSRITPAQLRTVFGKARNGVHSDAPPLIRSGRRCAAKAGFQKGRLVELEVWQAPPLKMTANPKAPLPRVAQRVIPQLERACAASIGRPRGWPVVAKGALHIAHLYQRYGSPELNPLQKGDSDGGSLEKGRHRFQMPGGRCVVQVDILDLLDPLNLFIVKQRAQ